MHCRRANPTSLIRFLLRCTVSMLLLLPLVEVLAENHGDANRRKAASTQQDQPSPYTTGHPPMAASAAERSLQEHYTSPASALATTGAAATMSSAAKKEIKASQPAPTAACRIGFYQGSRHEFWQYVDGKSPALMDLVHSQDRVYAVFNLQLPKPWGYVPWSNGTWSMGFHQPPVPPPLDAGDGNKSSKQTSLLTVPAYSLATDSSGYTLVVFAYLPKHLRWHPHQPQLVDVSVDMQGSSEVQQAAVSQATYKAVPFCWSPAAQVMGSTAGSPMSNASNLPTPDDVMMRATDVIPTPPSAFFHHLVSCTEILSSVVHLVPEWVVYHHLQGFEHFYIYVIDDPQLVSQQLQPLIKAGLVTVVDFRWPKEAREAYSNPKCPKCLTSWSQVAQMNSCIMRARGTARWVALHDVDEFFQLPPTPAAKPTHTRRAVPLARTGSGPEVPQRPSAATVAEFLTRRSAQESVAAFQVNTIWFGSHGNSSQQAALDASTSAQGAEKAVGVLQRYVSRAKNVVKGVRTKLVVSPTAVSYVAVHHMAVGGHVQPLDGTNEMRLCHYKQPHSRTYPVQDLSMSAQAEQVQQHLQSYYDS